MRRPEDVIPYLGKPSHWKQGRSAKSLADRWVRTNDVPDAVRTILHQADEYVDCELVDGWLERSTDLRDGRGSHSQTDLLAILGLRDGLAVLCVEAKVTESFGPIVGKWLAKQSLGKEDRLRRLRAMLGLSPEAAKLLRYQLLHRTAAALIEAKRYRTRQAVMLVHSFCENATGFADFQNFAAAIGYAGLEIGCISEARRLDGVSLRIGWVSDEVPEDLSWDSFFDQPPNPDFPTFEEIRGNI